ncbi:MAG: conjugal transfer protein TrbF, partial [Rhizobiaceae bacterium]|nr:conjugal transfer protein TrbF [Rhizobiaceae bacterium]
MSKTNPPENPYLAARQEWNERYGSYVKSASAWRMVGITSMIMAVIGFSYALYQSTEVKLVPYIVEVDRLGAAASAGFPQQIEYADPRVVRATLGSFISNFRSVTPDAVVQKQYIDKTYALLRSADPATEKINAWFRSNSPFDRARSMTIAIEVTN